MLDFINSAGDQHKKQDSLKLELSVCISKKLYDHNVDLLKIMITEYAQLMREKRV